MSEKQDARMIQEKLFDVMIGEGKYIVNNFSLAVFGIGALFIGLGSADTPRLKQLIDLIGFAASLIMWIHMHGSSREIQSIRAEMKNITLFQIWERTHSWRYKGDDRFTYYPVTRLMTYFMGLVALAWLSLILTSLGYSSSLVITLDTILLLSTLSLAIFRRLREITDP